MSCLVFIDERNVMNRVEELTEQLKIAILESSEYKEYKSLEDYMKRQPDLKRAVDEFRKLNFMYQYSDETGDVINETLRLNERFKDVRRQPQVDRYLSAEMCLCRMMQEICISLFGGIDFDMDFLKD